MLRLREQGRSWKRLTVAVRLLSGKPEADDESPEGAPHLGPHHGPPTAGMPPHLLASATTPARTSTPGPNPQGRGPYKHPPFSRQIDDDSLVPVERKRWWPALDEKPKNVQCAVCTDSCDSRTHTRTGGQARLYTWPRRVCVSQQSAIDPRATGVLAQCRSSYTCLCQCLCPVF
ncbi:hypothetical protein J6590_078807 [Homalodisca vitripennis]|nr:hypothetical protein J6590_078807 [Homalodisca vitripennis]